MILKTLSRWKLARNLTWPLRITLILTTLLFLLFPAVASEQMTETEQHIRKVLEEPFLCDFGKEVPLRTAVEGISHKAKINMILDHRAIEALNEKLDDSPEITVHAQLPFQMPLKDVLDYIVRQHDLKWFVQDEMVWITNKSVRSNDDRLVFKSYYVGDLVGIQRKIPEMSNHPHDVAVYATLGATADPDKLKAISKYILTMIAPESWEDGASIKPYFNSAVLVIRQSEPVHTQISDLLRNLRKINNLQLHEVEYPMDVLPNDSKTIHAFVYDVSDLCDADGNMEDLVKLIKETISRDDWGKSASIETVGKKLTITHNSFGHEKIIDLLRLLRTMEPANVFRLHPGDTLAIYIEGITGTPGQSVRVYQFDPELPPAKGFPLTVRDDGTLALPKIKETISVLGLSLKQTEALIRRTYEEQEIVKPGKTITVSLIIPRREIDTVINTHTNGGHGVTALP